MRKALVEEDTRVSSFVVPRVNPAPWVRTVSIGVLLDGFLAEVSWCDPSESRIDAIWKTGSGNAVTCLGIPLGWSLGISTR